MARVWDNDKEDYREMTPQEEAEFRALQAEMPRVALTPWVQIKQYSKVQMFKAMTDAEYETFEKEELKQPKRLRRVFTAASVLSEGDDLFALFEGLILGTYGEKRGRELLAAAEIK